jgi:hypothetical protein
MAVHREVNDRVIQALADARLLHRQVMTQPVAIRMPFARRVRPMLARRAVAIVVAVCVDRQSPMRRFANTTVVQIMPAASKHSMDEQ